MSQIIIPEGNVDLERLGLINQNLFPVRGKLAVRYNAILKHVFDFDSDIDEFRIDKRGISPEVAKHLKEKYPERLEFGENYLNIGSANRYMIVLSPEQKTAPLVAPQTSYENELYDMTHRQARHTIEDITREEAMYGELENHITLFRSAEDLLRMKTVEVSLDTINGTLKQIFKLAEMSENLGVNDNALNEEYMQEMRGLVKKVGDIRTRAVSNVFPIKRELHCFYVEFFNGVHCLRNFAPGKVKGIFITDSQPGSEREASDIIYRDIRDQDLLNLLDKYDFIRYNPDLIKIRIREIEEQVLLDRDIDVSELEPNARKRLLLQKTKAFPEVYHELCELEKMDGDKRIKGTIKDGSYELRLKLAEGQEKKDIVEHMLAELDPSDPIRLYNFNRKKLITEFPSMPLNRQRYIAKKLLNREMKGGGYEI